MSQEPLRQCCWSTCGWRSLLVSFWSSWFSALLDTRKLVMQTMRLIWTWQPELDITLCLSIPIGATYLVGWLRLCRWSVCQLEPFTNSSRIRNTPSKVDCWTAWGRESRIFPFNLLIVVTKFNKAPICFYYRYIWVKSVSSKEYFVKNCNSSKLKSSKKMAVYL